MSRLTREQFEHVALAFRTVMARCPMPGMDKFTAAWDFTNCIRTSFSDANPKFDALKFASACDPNDDSYCWRSVKPPKETP